MQYYRVILPSHRDTRVLKKNAREATCSTNIPNGILERNCTGHVGSYCQVVCNRGFRVRDGVLGIYCNKERRWSVKETGICQNVDGTFSENSSLNTEAGLVGAVAGFLTVCLIYIAVMMVKQKIKKLNDSDDFSLRTRRESVQRNDYLETVSFISPTINQPTSTCASEVGDNRPAAKPIDDLKKPGRVVQSSHEKKKHMYHNVFWKSSAYENV
ncbi:uncharacterized protein LOC125652789 isoform X2 [Ostrea edulis]|uniref:uncharacterized protein LOC125652789 isoform X2 n=1 Tax=Ostrea edulis TaxID=37623 RepID=UPI00209521B7|nr:uncharacterized protein LOC125652789 isoform X2 [Ostrea edulis]